MNHLVMSATKASPGSNDVNLGTCKRAARFDLPPSCGWNDMRTATRKKIARDGGRDKSGQLGLTMADEW